MQRSEIQAPQWLESAVTVVGVLTIISSDVQPANTVWLTAVLVLGLIAQEMESASRGHLKAEVHFRPHTNSGLLLGNLLIPLVTVSTLQANPSSSKVDSYYLIAVVLLCTLTPVAIILCAMTKIRLLISYEQRFVHQLLIIPVFGLLVWSSWLRHRLVTLVVLAVAIPLIAYFFLTRLLYFLPRSFTLGEAVFISESLTLLTLQAACSLTEGTGNLLACLQVLVLGCVVLGVAIYPVAKRLRMLSCGQRPFKEVDVAFKKLSAYFYLCLTAAIVLILLPWLGFLLRQEPLRWGVFFVTATRTRMLLFCLWLLLVIGAVGVVTLWGSSSTIVRKYFHLVAICIYVPGILSDVPLLHLASAGTLFIFVILEFLRIFRVWPVGDILHNAFTMFVDDQDCGIAILTHIYLLLGMALPVWLYAEVGDQSQTGISLAIYSGVLSLGAGDTAASVVGSLYGKTKWPGSKKTLEGTSAAILCQLLGCCMLVYLDPRLAALNRCRAGIIWAVTLTSVLEAVTTQIDNLVLPVFMYSLLLSLQ